MYILNAIHTNKNALETTFVMTLYTGYVMF